MAKKKAVRKDPATHKGRTKGVPTMKDVLSSHSKVENARKIMDLAREVATARKKEYEGTVADLSQILREIKAGQGKLF